MFYKMDVLESQKSQESTSGGVYFLMKLHSSRLLFVNLLKKSLAQLSSNEFCEIFKKSFLIEHCCFYGKLVIDFEFQ